MQGPDVIVISGAGAYSTGPISYDTSGNVYSTNDSQGRGFWGSIASGARSVIRAINPKTYWDKYRDWHGGRNLENDAELQRRGLHGRDDLTLGELEAGFTKATDFESQLHRLGEGNEKNLKFTSVDPGKNAWNRYGRYEIVVRPNADGTTFTHVQDPVNMGTLNRGRNPISHTFLDILPWKIFGNDPTRQNE